MASLLSLALFQSFGLGEFCLIGGLVIQFGAIVFGGGVLWSRVSTLRDDVGEIKADVKNLLLR